jgi:hypothetical protein
MQSTNTYGIMQERTDICTRIRSTRHSSLFTTHKLPQNEIRMLKYDTRNSGSSQTKKKKMEKLGEVSKAIPVQAMKAYEEGGRGWQLYSSNLLPWH